MIKINFHALAVKKAQEILDTVAIDCMPKNEFQEVRDFIISSSVRQLKSVKNELEEVEQQIKNILPQFGYKLQTMKGIDVITEASLIAQIGDINRFYTADKLAKYARVSPVSYSSGKTDKLLSNTLGDRKLHATPKPQPKYFSATRKGGGINVGPEISREAAIILLKSGTKEGVYTPLDKDARVLAASAGGWAKTDGSINS